MPRLQSFERRRQCACATPSTAHHAHTGSERWTGHAGSNRCHDLLLRLDQARMAEASSHSRAGMETKA
eukprot:11817703-Alexandrium_andersonii.AAC.1